MKKSALATTLAGSFVLATLIPGAAARAEPADFALDPAHTSIGFLVSHINYADVLGMFLESEGSFVFDEEAGTVSDIRIVINTESVFTNHEARDDHLRSPDFLNADEFPEMVFEADEAVAVGDGTGVVRGTLELLGETRPMELTLTFAGSGDYPFGDEHYAVGVSARGSFLRSEYGMTYGVSGDLVGDEVELIIEFEGIRDD